jgi:hypothetical protein
VVRTSTRPPWILRLPRPLPVHWGDACQGGDLVAVDAAELGQ